MSSGNESDDSSDVDSPGPPSLKTNTQSMLTEAVPAALDKPTSSSHQGHGESQQGQQAGAATSTSANEPIYYDEFKPSTTSQIQSPNNMMYPTSALANIPQEVLLGLIQSGHLQLHTEEDGSGHQYITIPLSMAAAAAASTNNSSGGAAHVKDLSSRASSSRENTSSSTTAAASVSSRDTIRIKKEFID